MERNDEYFRRLAKWNNTPSTWDDVDEDTLSTHTLDRDAFSTYSSDADTIVYPPSVMTKEEIREECKKRDYSHLWYAEYIVDGELTLTTDELGEEFRRRFIYPTWPKEIYGPHK